MRWAVGVASGAQLAHKALSSNFIAAVESVLTGLT